MKGADCAMKEKGERDEIKELEWRGALSGLVRHFIRQVSL